MRKVLVFGAGGMFGHVAVRYLSETGRYDVIPCARNGGPCGTRGVDVTDRAAVRDVLESVRPEVVLNAAGLLVKACEDRPDLAVLVNAHFPRHLARIGRELGYRLVHVSTDCVFSGKDGGYVETAFRDGDTTYARTKALGEVVDSANLTFRTSIVGPELKADGTGLLAWFLRQKGEVRGFTRAFWSGVTTLELAKAVDAAIQQDLTGLFHLAMPKISKCELLRLFKDVWRKADADVVPSGDFRCDKSLVCTRTDFAYRLPDTYREMLRELHDWYGA